MEKTVIFGPPGTGKTWTLISIMEKKIEEGIGIENIGFATFTKGGIDTAKERISSKLGVNIKQLKGNIGTIHSLCFRSIGMPEVVDPKKHQTEFCKKYGLEYDAPQKINVEDASNEDIFTSEDASELKIGNIIFSFYDVLRNRFIKDIDEITEREFNSYWSKTFLSDPLREKRMYINPYYFLKEWKEWKESNNLIDFGDMLMIALKQKMDLNVDILIIDEFQDLFPLQYQLYKTWIKGKEVFIAGDDDQAIFNFAGADAEFLLKERDDASQIKKLDISHRLPTNILKFCRNFIEENVHNREPKNFITMISGGNVSFINYDQIRDYFKPEKKTFFLFRTNYYKYEFIKKFLWENNIIYLNTRGPNIWNQTTTIPLYNIFVNLKKGLPILHEDLKFLLKYVRSKKYLERGLKTKLDKDEIQQPSYTVNDMKRIGIQREFFTEPLSNIISSFIKLGDTSKKVLSNQEFTHLITRINTFAGTIHSVKGWEADDVFLFTDIPKIFETQALSSTKDWENEARVLYVGMSRARERLFLIPSVWRHPLNFSWGS